MHLISVSLKVWVSGHYMEGPTHYPYPTSYPDSDEALLEEGLDGSIDGRGWRN